MVTIGCNRNIGLPKVLEFNRPPFRIFSSEPFMATPIDLVSTLEIAQRLGVEKNTVHQWRYRGIFPEPDWQLSIGPVWKWQTIERWAKQTGRAGKGSE